MVLRFFTHIDFLLLADDRKDCWHVHQLFVGLLYGGHKWNVII